MCLKQRNQRPDQLHLGIDFQLGVLLSVDDVDRAHVPFLRFLNRTQIVSVGTIRDRDERLELPVGTRYVERTVLYPAKGHAHRGRGFDELAYYAEHFDTVEVNSTFYRVPEPHVTCDRCRTFHDR